MNDPTLRKFWEDCHIGNNEYAVLVSDGNGSNLWRSLNIFNRILKRTKVLEIGVGQGSDIRKINEAGSNVYALDISQQAIDKVKDIIKGSWLAENIDTLPSNFFDVVISHLVTQHMSNEDFKKQLKAVLRSLNSKGVFALQFADRIDGIPDKEYNESVYFQKTGSVCRNFKMMERLIDEAGGKIIWSDGPINFPKNNSRWFYLNIVNKT